MIKKMLLSIAVIMALTSILTSSSTIKEPTYKVIIGNEQVMGHVWVEQDPYVPGDWMLLATNYSGVNLDVDVTFIRAGAKQTLTFFVPSSANTKAKRKRLHTFSEKIEIVKYGNWAEPSLW